MQPDPTAGRHISCTLTGVMLHLVAEEAGGDAGIERLLAVAGSARERRYLEAIDNWISIDEAVALLRAAVEVTGGPDAPRRVGARAVQQHAGTGVATLLRSLGAPEVVLQSI